MDTQATSFLTIDKACPRCSAKKSLHLRKNSLECSVDSCSFKLNYMCPLCDSTLLEKDIIASAKDTQIHCNSCQKNISLKKIQYLLNNGLIIDHKKTCETCHGPTIRKYNIPLGHRCFFFPACSGQADLFGNTKESIVFLDFETTGLDIGKDNIIEIGALKINEDGIESTFQCLVKPEHPLPPKIIQITGITDDMLINAEPFQKSIAALFSFIGTSSVVAHNADFDIPWLITSALKLSLPIPENKVFCTLKWAKNNQETRASLGALTKKYNITHDNAHRALADAIVTKEIYFIFENNYTKGKTEQTFSDFLAHSKKLLAVYSTVT